MAKPVAVRDLAKITVSKGMASGNVLANDYNPDGGQVLLRFVDGSRIGYKAPASIAVEGKYGTFLFKEDGTYTYTLDKTNPIVINAHGGNPLVEKISYKISDGKGGTDHDFLQISIYPDHNAKPVAVHDDVDVFGGLASGNLLANDFDPDGDALQVSFIGKKGDMHYISQGSTVTVDTLYGHVTIGRDGHFTYDLDENNPAVIALGENGVLQDKLLYKIFDGGLSNSADQDTVTFTIHHDGVML